MKLVIVFLCIFLIPDRVAAEKVKPKSGPYKSQVLNGTRCAKPSRPYQKEPFIRFDAEVYMNANNDSLLRGNITVFKEYADYRIKGKSSVNENGKWKVSFVTNSAGCRGVLITILNVALGLNYDKEKCTIAKGTYSFANIDINQMEHAWTTTKIYGLTLWRTEVFYQSETVECWEYYTLVSPLQK